MDLSKSSEKTLSSLLSAIQHSKQTEKSCLPFGTGKKTTARFTSSFPPCFRILVNRSFKSTKHSKETDFVKWGDGAIFHIVFPFLLHPPHPPPWGGKTNCYYIKQVKNLFQIASNKTLSTTPSSLLRYPFFSRMKTIFRNEKRNKCWSISFCKRIE